MRHRLQARAAVGLFALWLAACAAIPPTSQTTPSAGSTKQGPRPSEGADACDQPSDCVLVEATCCGTCSMPSASDYVAMRADRVSTLDRSECRDVESCLDCLNPTNPTLVATCRAGRCAVLDLQRAPMTRCGAGYTCVLAFSRCCECGAGRDSVVAIRDGTQSALALAMCGSRPQVCPECVGVMPLDLEAQCVAGRCVAQSRAD